MPPRVNNEHLHFARALRSSMTAAETLLWRILRNRRIGAKFRRQVPIGPYVADFACVAARLIVELDGEPHDTIEQGMRDNARDTWFETQGWTVIRIANLALLSGPDIVVDCLREAIRDSPHPTLADARATFSRIAVEGTTDKDHP